MERSRRTFLTGAAITAAGAATLGVPAVAKAQGPITMRWQSTWPQKDIFHEYAQDFAKKVNDMTGGDLKIEVLPAGAVVPAFGLLDAVSKGTLDGGHGVLVYHYGKQTALALWGSGPAYGMDANMLLSWHKYGGGKQLLQKLYASIGANVVSFPYGPMFTQPLGWYKKPITKADDFKGLKFRTVGISIDLFQGMGAAVNALPGAEIVPAMDRGLLDAAEFNNATSDRILGFADVSKVCMLQSYHQNAEQLEITFNKAKFDALPDKMKAIIESSVEAASADMAWKSIDRYSKDYIELQTKDKVRFYKTPDSVLQKQLEIYDQVADKKATDNALFKEIIESQRAFAARAVKWDLDTNVSRRMAYNHYFAAKPAATKKSERTGGPPSAPHLMTARAFIRAIDQISYWSGKAASWLIVALTFVVSIEVFKRYILNAPTAWIFDFNNMLYGTLFMMCGAYTLALAGHVRADFVYIYMKPRGQASLDLILYLLFFVPCMIGLIYAGSDFAADSWRIGEHSTVTAEGPPVYHFKTVIPVAGILVMLQGLAEIVRCVITVRTGRWPQRLEDVEEIDVIETQLGRSEYVDEESRRAAMEGAKAIDEAARHRSVMEEGVVHERAIRDDEETK
jgi:TRAP-type mannitol/chloroaromatic compound transport system substrate-binding protein/TRAP-type mannitol/chloroaromatic compound transport system permease small subunit